MPEFSGPIHLSEAGIERIAAAPGVFALGFARPQEGSVFISFVGRSDTDLKEALRAHVGGRYTACFWRLEPTPEAAYRTECECWHEMGGGDLDSGLHPVPPGDLPCPICG